jgi:hypothetical protein
VFADLRALLVTPPLPRSLLAVDQTGVGRPVVRLLRDGLRGQVACLFVPVTITSGYATAVGEEAGILVPRKELVGALQVLLQARRLVIPRGLPDAGLLVKELENFKIKHAAAKEDDLAAWRDGAHDDLVLAVVPAARLGEFTLPPLYGET